MRRTDIRICDEQGVDDLVRGATFFGTGGGGSPAEGSGLLKGELAEGREIGWVAKEAVSDDGWTACVSFMGNRAPLTSDEAAKMKSLGLNEWKFKNNLVEAVLRLQDHTGFKMEAIVPPELGGSNTPGPLAAGSRLGIPVVDGDYAGRALPEIAQMTPCLFGKVILPVVSVDKWGNIVFIEQAVSYELVERIGKMLAMAAFGNTGLAFALPSAVMKKIVIPDTLSRCYQIGKSIRKIRDGGGDPVNNIVDACEGYLLFKGEVVEKEWKIVDGCYCGTHIVSGTDRFRGHQLRIWFKNENHMTWLDRNIYVTSPDLITQIDLRTCEPIPNHELERGQSIAVIGMKSPQQYRISNGIQLAGPKRYGFDLDYVPIEETLDSENR